MRLGRFLFVCSLTPFCCSAAQHPDWDGLRQRISSALHIPDPLPNLLAKSYGSFPVAEGVAADRVAFSTAYDLRVPGIVYRPAGASITQHPALIIVNGHEGDKSSWYAYWAGILYARAGAVVLTYDPMGEYERNAERRSRTNQHDGIVQPEQQMAVRTAGSMITDVMQGARYLSTRKDVDPKRISVLGFSMGSFVSALSCALDIHLNACVLVGGGNLDGPGQHWDHARPMCESLPYQALSFLGDRGTVLYALNAQRGPTLVINGSEDQMEEIPKEGEPFFSDLRKRTIAEAGTSKNVFEYQFVAGGRHAPYFLTRNAALWLEEKLKFPNWTRKQIQQMPETKVLQWGQAQHLPQAQEKGFIENSGPLPALGNNIPAVPRADLHALPEAVWDSQRADFVYETWLERAKAAVETNAP